MLKEPKPFSGTTGTLRLTLPAAQFLAILNRQGLEYHVSLSSDHHLPFLSKFAESINLPLIALQ